MPMLQDNGASRVDSSDGAHSARTAHAAHAGVVALHALCCGAPIALSLISIGAASAAGVAVNALHEALHRHELWLLAVSAALVALGGYAEARAFAGGRRAVPWLYLASIACFVINVAIVVSHRL